MKNKIKAAITALALAGGAFAIAPPASADHVTVGISVPTIAFGYSDGYWDRERHWHRWRNHEEAEHFRAENREHYYEWKHNRDHDRDLGWRDSDRWWDRH